MLNSDLLDFTLERHTLTDILPGNNARSSLKEAEVKALAESIRLNGLNSPPTVNFTGGEYKVVAGFKRFAALQMLRDGYTVTINKKEHTRKGDPGKYGSVMFNILSDASEADLILLNLMENTARSDLNPMELAIGLNKAYELHPDKSEGTIARGIGVSGERASRLKNFPKLPEQVRKLLLEGEDYEGKDGSVGKKFLCEATAYQLTRLLKLGESADEMIRKLAIEINFVGLTEAKVKAKIDKILKENGKPKKDKKKPLTGKYRKAQEALESSAYATFSAQVKPNKNGGGSVTLKFDDEENLPGLVKMLFKGCGNPFDDTEDTEVLSGEAVQVAEDTTEPKNDEHRFLDGSVGRIPTEQEAWDFAEAICDGKATFISMNDIGAATTGTKRIEYRFNSTLYELTCPITDDPAALGAAELCDSIMEQDFYGLSMYIRTDAGAEETEVDPFPAPAAPTAPEEPSPFEGMRTSDIYAIFEDALRPTLIDNYDVMCTEDMLIITLYDDCIERGAKLNPYYREPECEDGVVEFVIELAPVEEVLAELVLAPPADPEPTPIPPKKERKPTKKQKAEQMIAGGIDPHSGERFTRIISTDLPDLPDVVCETIYEDDEAV